MDLSLLESLCVSQNLDPTKVIVVNIDLVRISASASLHFIINVHFVTCMILVVGG
jgi:hypothetical protein